MNYVHWLFIYVYINVLLNVLSKPRPSQSDPLQIASSCYTLTAPTHSISPASFLFSSWLIWRFIHKIILNASSYSLNALLGIPKTTLSFSVSPERLTRQNSEKLLYTHSWFITVKGYRLKSAKPNSIQIRVQERLIANFKLSFPNRTIQSA